MNISQEGKSALCDLVQMGLLTTVGLLTGLLFYGQFIIYLQFLSRGRSASPVLSNHKIGEKSARLGAASFQECELKSNIFLLNFFEGKVWMCLWLVHMVTMALTGHRMFREKKRWVIHSDLSCGDPGLGNQRIGSMESTNRNCVWDGFGLGGAGAMLCQGVCRVEYPISVSKE